MKTSSNNLVVKDFVLINGFVVDVDTITTNDNNDFSDNEKYSKAKYSYGHGAYDDQIFFYFLKHC